MDNWWLAIYGDETGLVGQGQWCDLQECAWRVREEKTGPFTLDREEEVFENVRGEQGESQLHKTGYGVIFPRCETHT